MLTKKILALCAALFFGAWLAGAAIYAADSGGKVPCTISSEGDQVCPGAANLNSGSGTSAP